MPEKQKTEKAEKVVVEAVEPDENPVATDAVKAEADGEILAVEYDGATYRILTDLNEDIELVEAFAAYNAGDGLQLPGILEALLGADQYAELKDRYADPETGRTPYVPLQKVFLALDRAMGK